MRILLPVIALCLLSGCSLFNRGGKISTGGVTVTAQPDAGKPATLSTAEAGTSMAIPAGSTIKVTQTEAQPATKDKPSAPAITVTEIVPSAPTEIRHTEKKVNADSGTVDTSVALKKIEAAESRVLLYVSIGAALLAGFFVWAQYPTPAIACGVASAVFFMAWKLTDLPDWFWAVGAVAIAAGVAIYLGHKRGLYEPVPPK